MSSPDPETAQSSFAFISHNMSTFPDQQPRIDNAQLARRKRRRTSPTELNILELEFHANSRPDRHKRKKIASKVNMTEKAVQIWFQNKRQSWRKKKHVILEIPTPENDHMSSQLTQDSSVNCGFEIYEDPAEPILSNTKMVSFNFPEPAKALHQADTNVLGIRNDSDKNRMSINRLISSPVKSKTISDRENIISSQNINMNNLSCRDQLDVECISNLLSLRWAN